MVRLTLGQTARCAVGSYKNDTHIASPSKIRSCNGTARVQKLYVWVEQVC
jgi:hypothetical protein